MTISFIPAQPSPARCSPMFRPELHVVQKPNHSSFNKYIVPSDIYSSLVKNQCIRDS